MATNIEKLQTRVDEAKTRIKESRELSTPEKIEKAKELETVISQIKSDLDSLKTQANKEELAEIKALESSYEELNSQFQAELQQEFSDLEEEVASTIPKPTNESTYWDTESDIDSEGQKIEWTEVSKGWFWKRWRDSLWSWWKKAVRVWGGIAAWLLAFKWLRWLFNSKEKNKKRREARRNNKYNRWWRRWLKRLGVATWWYYLAHGVVTRRWGLSEMFNWDKKTKAEELKDSKTIQWDYKDWSALEKKQRNGIWSSVNNFFRWIYGTRDGMNECDLLWEKTIYWKFHDTNLWTIPANLDNDYDDVWDIMDSESRFDREIDKLCDNLWEWVDPTQLFSDRWITKKEYENLDDIQKKERLNQSYYRKRLKIKVYLREKEKVLRRKIASELYNTPYDSQALDEILLDEEKRDNIDDKLDVIFRSRKLKDVQEVLKKYSISDEEIVPKTKKRIDEVEKRREETKWDIFSKELEGAGATQKELLWVCNWFHSDIMDPDNRWEVAGSILGWFWDAIDNNSEIDKEQILKDIWYDWMTSKYINTIQEVKNEITTGTHTKKDIQRLNRAYEDYFMLQKEIALWVMQINESDEEDGMVNRVLLYLGGKLIWVLNLVYDAAGGWIQWVIWVVITWRLMYWAGKYIVRKTPKAVKWTLGKWVTWAGNKTKNMLKFKKKIPTDKINWPKYWWRRYRKPRWVEVLGDFINKKQQKELRWMIEWDLSFLRRMKNQPRWVSEMRRVQMADQIKLLEDLKSWSRLSAITTKELKMISSLKDDVPVRHIMELINIWDGNPSIKKLISKGTTGTKLIESLEKFKVGTKRVASPELMKSLKTINASKNHVKLFENVSGLFNGLKRVLRAVSKVR